MDEPLIVLFFNTGVNTFRGLFFRVHSVNHWTPEGGREGGRERERERERRGGTARAVHVMPTCPPVHITHPRTAHLRNVVQADGVV